MTWNGAGVSGVRVEVHEFVFPTLGGTLYGSGVTDASGTYRIVGLPVSANLDIEFPEQASFNFSGSGALATCGGRVVSIGDYPVVRMVTGLNVSETAPAQPGAFTLRWDAVPSAVAYCVALWQDQTATAMYPSSCFGYQSSIRVTTTNVTTPPLTAGRRYVVRVDALGPTTDSDGLWLGQLRYGAVWFDVR